MVPSAQRKKRENAGMAAARNRVARAFAVLEAFTPERPSLVLSDIARRAGLPLTTVHRLLAELCGGVYSVEVIDELARRAVKQLKRQGYTNIEVRVGNGYSGWPEHAPFDKVIVTAAPDLIPPPLIYQLKAGGKMVIPVGLPDTQQLVVAEKEPNGKMTMKQIMPVRFSLLEEADESPIGGSRPS